MNLFMAKYPCDLKVHLIAKIETKLFINSFLSRENRHFSTTFQFYLIFQKLFTGELKAIHWAVGIGQRFFTNMLNMV